MTSRQIQQKTRRVAFLGLLFALAILLSFIEGLVPPLPMMPPGVKLGLANIVTMYCLVLLDFRAALTVTALKGLFAFLTRGAVAAAMSLGGSVLSLLVMALVWRLTKKRCSMLTMGLTGGFFHNMGQLCVSVLILKTTAAFYYLPVLAVAGLVMGFITGVTLQVLMPHIGRLQQDLGPPAGRRC